MVPNVTITLNKTGGDEHWLFCLVCSTQTFHRVLLSAEETGGYDVFQWWDNHEIVQCQGCRELSFRKHYWDSHTEDFVELYPMRVAAKQEFLRSYLLPRDILVIYRETVLALNNNLSILASVGIRAIAEAVCEDRKAVGKNLYQKIDSLVEEGVLTREGAEILHSLRILGNEAAHQVKAATPEHLKISFDVIEHLLMSVYILSEDAKELPRQN